MRILRIAILLASSSLLVAQQGAPATVQISASPQVFNGACPIGIEAQQHQRTPLLLTNDGSASPHPVYSIALLPRMGRLFRSVEIEMVGPTSLHLENVSEAPVHAADAREHFTLAKLNNADVRTAHLTAVRWIDLVSITYLDGTMWHIGDPNTCRVFPDMFVPV